MSTPIQIISGYIETLEEKEDTLTPQRLDIIKTELDHLRRLVGDLTTLSQAEAGGLEIQLEPVRPEVLLERVYCAFQPIAARQGIDLVVDVPESIASILVDEGRMVQVLKNALRYTPKGGKIQLSAVSGDGATGELSPDRVDESRQVQLHIKDSCQGIDAEDLPYVFDRFYRADPSRGANSGKMGLGMAICKALVTAQGGAPP